MNTSLKKFKFIEKINDYIKEMKVFKTEEEQHWKEDYDVMLDELEDISSIAKGNIIEAESSYNELPVSKFSSFKDYVTNTDPAYLKETSGTNSRFKSSRAKRKKHSICPQCGEKMVMIDNQFKCDKCSFTIEVKSSQTGSISGEDSKHSNKLIHTIAGIGKPPGSIQKILNHAVTWLTDLHYLKDWFIAHRERYEVFNKAYRKETGTPLTWNFFDRVIERKQENIWKISIYHLLMKEFQQMLEEAKALSTVSSNMWYMKTDDIYNIVKKYKDENGDEIPATGVKTGDNYEIGAYFAQLSLMPVFETTHVKARLEELYGKKLSMLGLSFNFTETFNRSETVIRPYDLLQGNSWIQRYVFNMPTSTITEMDISNILQIMLRFNIYYKEYWYKQKLKSCNAPLYAVVLDLILSLPAFRRFKDELMIFVPKKEPKTRAQISNTWMRFEQQHRDFLSKFLKTDDDSIIREPLPPQAEHSAYIEEDEEENEEEEEENEEVF